MRTDEIVNKVFTRSFMGYDIEQVDLFLDEIIETLERYEAEKREMLSAMEYLMKKLERGQKMPLSDMKKAIDDTTGLSLSLKGAETYDSQNKVSEQAVLKDRELIKLSAGENKRWRDTFRTLIKDKAAEADKAGVRVWRL